MAIMDQEEKYKVSVFGHLIPKSWFFVILTCPDTFLQLNRYLWELEENICINFLSLEQSLLLVEG